MVVWVAASNSGAYPVSEYVISPISIPPGQLVTARSFLIDRIKADVEIVALPEKSVAGGPLTWSTGPVLTPPKRSKRLRSILSKPTHSVPEGRWIINLKRQNPLNWAHFLNNHLPLTFALADMAGLEPEAAIVVLPEETPGYIRAAAELFELEIMTTDDAVEGMGLQFSVNPWVAIRAARVGWARLPKPRAVIEKIDAGIADQDLPRKVFLSRRDTRVLSNEAEIETILAERGFQKIYPETLSAADQLRLFRRAEEMVAIHGAGLAPLLYCTPDAGPRVLVEILPAGHMTDVFRAIAHHVGSDWIGVRGRLKPEYVRPAYQFDQKFTAYSLDAFEVDPVSLETAFELLKERQEA